MRSALTRSHLPGTLWIFFTFGFDLTLPAGLADTGDLTLVGQLPEADTAYAVIAQVSMGSAADLAAVIAAAGELRLSLLLQDHRLFSHLLIPPKSSGEGSAQKRQQLLGLLVGFRKRRFKSDYRPLPESHVNLCVASAAFLRVFYQCPAAATWHVYD